MIALEQTRSGLLAEIAAADPPPAPLRDLTDPRVANEDVRVRIKSDHPNTPTLQHSNSPAGHARDALFSLLKLALTERFAAVARRELICDLLVPLRNALGNAFKHGNGNDPLKCVTVELVLTRKGVLIAVTDEGAGFDARLTFRRLQSDAVTRSPVQTSPLTKPALRERGVEEGEGQKSKSYFANRGDGFRHLHGAKATVSFENGGRTVLLCFRPKQDKAVDSGSWMVDRPRPAHLSTINYQRSTIPASSAEPPDGRWLQDHLAAEVPEFSSDRTIIKSCRRYAGNGRGADGCGPRYVLQLADREGGPARTQVLTGRLHDSAIAAVADFEAATKLHAAKELKGLRIPRPVARLASAPRFVLFEFDPWLNLREFLTQRSSLDTLRHCVERVGRALARLHRSEVTFCSGAPERNAGESPIHASLNWDSIHYGADGRFYLYRFETCRRGDPGLDLGSFVAELRDFTLAHHDVNAYRDCLHDFLASYNSRADRPMSEDQLRLYVLLALTQRAGRMQRQTQARRQVSKWSDGEMEL